MCVIEVLYTGAAGRTGFDQGSPAWTGDTFTWVASLTKLITAMCLIKLVEDGKISLEDDLRTIVPELGQMQVLRGFDDDGKPKLEDNPEPITLR